MGLVAEDVFGGEDNYLAELFEGRNVEVFDFA